MNSLEGVLGVVVVVGRDDAEDEEEVGVLGVVTADLGFVVVVVGVEEAEEAGLRVLGVALGVVEVDDAGFEDAGAPGRPGVVLGAAPEVGESADEGFEGVTVLEVVDEGVEEEGFEDEALGALEVAAGVVGFAVVVVVLAAAAAVAAVVGPAGAALGA